MLILRIRSYKRIKAVPTYQICEGTNYELLTVDKLFNINMPKLKQIVFEFFDTCYS